MPGFRKPLIAVLLIALILLAYAPVARNDFIVFDDRQYIVENPHVAGGLTLENAIWAFKLTEKKSTYWHPIAWLSHMADVELFGLDPRGHHLVNVLLHTVNTLLLLTIFARSTGAFWKSALVAGLFALHPLNVETVAFAAERKNLLSMLFGLLCILAYLRYSESPRATSYMSALAFFIFSLLAKPMLVTLPFILILLNYWPLGTLPVSPVDARSGDTRGEETAKRFRRVGVKTLLLEMIPFLCVTLVSIALSTYSLTLYDNMISTAARPMDLRVFNALVGYVLYVAKTVWPANLAIFYPYPKVIPAWQAAGAALFVAGVSYLVLRHGSRKPYFPVGWLWFLGSLLPVSGLSQAGLWPRIADRWAYFPLIGIFLMAAWGLPGLARALNLKKWLPVSACLLALVALAWATRVQTAHWRSSITIFQQAAAVTTGNHVAHWGLGQVLLETGRLDESVRHNRMAIAIMPRYADAHYNLALALKQKGDYAGAVKHYREVLSIEPRSVDAHINLGNIFLEQDDLERAIFHYRSAIAIDYRKANAHNGLGAVLYQKGIEDEAIAHFKAALRIEPTHKQARANLALALRHEKIRPGRERRDRSLR